MWRIVLPDSGPLPLAQIRTPPLPVGDSVLVLLHASRLGRRNVQAHHRLGSGEGALGQHGSATGRSFVCCCLSAGWTPSRHLALAARRRRSAARFVRPCGRVVPRSRSEGSFSSRWREPSLRGFRSGGRHGVEFSLSSGLAREI